MYSVYMEVVDPYNGRVMGRLFLFYETVEAIANKIIDRMNSGVWVGDSLIAPLRNTVRSFYGDVQFRYTVVRGTE